MRGRSVCGSLRGYTWGGTNLTRSNSSSALSSCWPAFLLALNGGFIVTMYFRRFSLLCRAQAYHSSVRILSGCLRDRSGGRTKAHGYLFGAGDWADAVMAPIGGDAVHVLLGRRGGRGVREFTSGIATGLGTHPFGGERFFPVFQRLRRIERPRIRISWDTGILGGLHA